MTGYYLAEVQTGSALLMVWQQIIDGTVVGYMDQDGQPIDLIAPYEMRLVDGTLREAMA
jgi:hypothetical protein